MSEFNPIKIRDIDLFGERYQIDVLKNLNENDMDSTAYVAGRTHFAHTTKYELSNNNPTITLAPLSDGEGFIVNVFLEAFTTENDKKQVVFKAEKIITAYVSIPEAYGAVETTHTIYTDNTGREAKLKIKQIFKSSEGWKVSPKGSRSHALSSMLSSTCIPMKNVRITRMTEAGI
jgi:hypothetical protein